MSAEPNMLPDLPPAPASGGSDTLPDSVTLQDFYAYLPTHQYIFTPTRQLWPAASVNARVSVPKGKASELLDQTRAVEMMTWAPGFPTVIENNLFSDGGWMEHPGCHTFNLYMPPTEIEGDKAKAEHFGAQAKIQSWKEQLKKPDEAG